MDAIPAYIINLSMRTDRREHILKEFARRDEFRPVIVQAEEHRTGAVGLWNTIMRILRNEIDTDHRYIVICEDDHQFSDHYSVELLLKAISQAEEKKADVLCGGVSWFTNALAVPENIFWMEKFSGLQFTILFRRFFKTILAAPFEERDAADTKISLLTVNKFFIFPFISIQRDFGYSDVTPRNNQIGRVEALFMKSFERAKTVKYICDYYRDAGKSISAGGGTDACQELAIPTYIIPTTGRAEGLAHIKRQFAGRTEFSISVMRACKQEDGNAGLWQCIREAVKGAIADEDDLVILVQDTHEFTEHYSKEFLFRNILEAYRQRIEILSGGVGGFDLAVPVTASRIWINSFLSVQFLVLFKSIFQKIVDAVCNEGATVDERFSTATGYKMTLFPFISVQKAFGYFDSPRLNDGISTVSGQFSYAANRLELVRRMYDKYCSGILDGQNDTARPLTELIKRQTY